MRQKFSVLMSVYRGDSYRYFDLALRSIWFHQSIRPDEIVLVIDGPVGSDIEAIVDAWKNDIRDKLVIVKNPHNLGLAKSLNIGIKNCNFPLIGRMDSDDISKPDRFEKQLDYFARYEDLDLLGTDAIYFDEDMKCEISKKKMPKRVYIRKSSQLRVPFVHPTIMFKKATVVSVGGYPENLGIFEDWGLSLRLVNSGASIDNLSKYLLYVRAGEDLIKRRGGFSYLFNELKYINIMKREGLITFGSAIKNIVIRVLVRLMPVKIRSFLYGFIWSSSRRN